ncbi:MAG: type II toxin-antitoxin system VapC family toxin [Planctomycetales bacterium]|nr:type II toxin-antitoxin system VapC family toxin [Planctomycetales bacterium]
MESWYLDTGVFATPMLKNREPSVIAGCEGWLARAAAGSIEAVTSAATWEEVVFVAGSAHGGWDRRLADGAGDRFLALGNLHRLAVTETEIRKAQELLLKTGLKSYDCLHLASAVLHNAIGLVTVDGELATEKTRAAVGSLRVILLGAS